MQVFNFKAGETIRWIQSGQAARTGVVVERVRAKVKPVYAGKCTEGVPSKKEVSYIIKSEGKHLWIEPVKISSTGLVYIKSLATKPSQNKPAAKTPSVVTNPQKTRTNNSLVKIAKTSASEIRIGIPDVFKRSFDSLLAYRRPCVSI